MGANNSNDENAKNKNLDHSNKKGFIRVKIPINSSVWEKSYNIENTTLNQIASDFKYENGMDIIQKKHYLEWRYKGKPIEMNSTKIKYFITIEDDLDNLPPIEITQQIRLIPCEIDYNKLKISEIVGKPFFNPFEIFTFETNQKIIKIKNYNKNIINQTKLNKFGIDSAYCNGKNHLFISGGLDPITNENLDLFWDIDLKNNNLGSPIKMLIPKKNHSMIFEEDIVYIIGGDDESTMFYDTQTKTITNWAKLNKKRFEPSLIRHDNYLFCFDASRKENNDKFSFEQIDIDIKQNQNWEIIYPDISPEIGDNVYRHKFFGVLEDFSQNILFLGGIKDNTENKDIEKDTQKMNIKYNIPRNIIEKTDIAFEEISFGEKTFLPLDYNNYFILPNFSKRAPKIVFYNKENNLLQITTCTSNHKTDKKKKNNNTNFAGFIKSSLMGLNFDMPGFLRNKKVNQKKNKNHLSSNEDNINFNLDINKNDIKTNKNDTNKFETTKNDTNIIKTNNNQISLNDSEIEKSNKYINIDNIKTLKTNYDINNTIVSSNIDKKNSILKKEKKQKKGSKKRYKSNNKITDENNDSYKTETNINLNSENEDLKNKEKYIGYSKIDTVKTVKDKIIEEENSNNSESQNKDSKEENIPKNNLEIKKETEIRDESINNIENASIKIKVKNGGNIIAISPKKEKNFSKIEFKALNIKNIKNFHSSVNAPCENFKTTSRKNIIFPKKISMKLIKINANKILKEEKNKVKVNNY